MSSKHLPRVVAVAALCGLIAAGSAVAQPPGGFGPGGPRPEPEIEGIPRVPTAVALPTISAAVTGPGAMFDSAPSQARGLDTEHFRYKTTEYFVSGTAAGKPYTTRVVVRQPADDGKFTGLVLAESMHVSGAAHMFEFTSGYLMDSGHAAVEILTTSPQQFVAFNAPRYERLKVENGQQNEIIAQVGALVRSSKGPLGARVRKMVLGGTSMSAGTLINYLPAHMVFRTPEMNRIFDGFMPTSNGSTIREIDVPMIHMPTMHEVETNVTRRQDGDEPGKQYRLYEFAAIGHVDSRDNARLLPNPCAKPLSTFLTQAYFSVSLYHLLRWVDEGIVPPRARAHPARPRREQRRLDDGARRAGQPGRRHPQPVRRRADGKVRARQHGRRSRHREPERVRASQRAARCTDHVPLERVPGAVLRGEAARALRQQARVLAQVRITARRAREAKAGRCRCIAPRSWRTSRRRSSSAQEPASRSGCVSAGSAPARRFRVSTMRDPP